MYLGNIVLMINILFFFTDCVIFYLLKMWSKSFGRKREERFYTLPHIYPDFSSSSDKKCGETSILKRKRVQKALETFRDLSHNFYCDYKSNQLDQLYNFKAKIKALTDAANAMKEKDEWENTRKRIGHVDGINVGDLFQYRAELVVIGLHQQFQNGIDYLDKGENSLATSIVVTPKYSNVMKSSGSLIYEGQGSNPRVRKPVAPHDQKLEKGNLALRNSMNAKRPVRVILKIFGKFDCMEEWRNNVSNCSFKYDGLYSVDTMTQERGEFGKLVFKFKLNKLSDQPARVSLSPRDVVMETETFQKRFKSRNHAVPKDIVLIIDISEGKEKFPIRVVKPKSCEEIVKPFDYLVRMAYPKMNHKLLGGGCNCANAFGGCLNCVCIAKNGGAISYDGNKRLVSPLKSSFIYECGPSCACSSSCINRVSQCGIQFQLEIFRTKSKGWGVRTRSFIPSGSFVCELVGEFVHHNNKNAGSNLHAANYIFNLGNVFVDDEYLISCVIRLFF
jgi:euchromatic histone-lysine N-methyltransferase